MHVIVYDGDCRFCTSVARWAASRARVPVAAIPFEDLPREMCLTSLSDAEILRQAHFITPDGVEHHGAAAATAALRLTRYAILGRLLDVPPISIARDAGYALACRWRGTLSRALDRKGGR